jgi:hypothetical protein
MNDGTSLVAQICQLINGWDGGSPTFFGPVAEKEIVRAEQKLGTTLPPSYRCFLRHFGGGFVFDYEILGLVQESGHWLDIVHVNCLVPRYIPREYVRFVYAPGNGDYYLDTSRRDALGECPVVIFNPSGEDVPIADSFLDFLGKAKDRLI